MRVRWYGMIYKGESDSGVPILERDKSHAYEGEVVGLVPQENNIYT